MFFLKRKYKDSVFTDLFGSDRDGKKNFLSLYNALSGKNYSEDDVSIRRKIIDQTLYKTYNNDVSWEIDGKLIVLVEHQSTINENMPFRCLEYVTRIYEGIVPPRKRYNKKAVKLPNPDFYVVYVGKDNYPQEKVLKLSDSFYTSDSSKLDLTVTVKNCSDVQNLPFTQNCDILKQYCEFIEIVEKYYDKRNPRESFRKAIYAATDENILVDYLDRKSREVINMLCARYSYKTDIAVQREEAAEDRAEKDAINAIKLGLSDEQVIAITDLTLERLSELKEKLEAEEREKENTSENTIVNNTFESIVIQDAKSEGRAEGLVEGAQQKAVEAAINLLKMKLGTVEQIAQAQGLTVEKIIELKSQVDKER